jgi:hypothetical protein
LRGAPRNAAEIERPPILEAKRFDSFEQSAFAIFPEDWKVDGRRVAVAMPKVKRNERVLEDAERMEPGNYLFDPESGSPSPGS